MKLAATLGGAGVIRGDLTPECAEFVQTVLDALSAPAGADDDRTHEQRYHDALQEAMRRLLAAGLLPERGGQPVRVWAHISLADLMLHRGLLGAAGGMDLRTCGPGGPGTGPPPPRRAATRACGWTGTPPRRSPATRPSRRW